MLLVELLREVIELPEDELSEVGVAEVVCETWTEVGTKTL